MPVPADSHVHSEWSWDAPEGAMHATCEQAVRLGLPAVAFTEHVDHTAWRIAAAGRKPGDHLSRLSVDGLLHPPTFDAAGYLDMIEECRERYPELRILSGIEVGEPHRHEAAVTGVLTRGQFDRVLGSLHTLAEDGGFAEPPGLYEHRRAADVLRDYLHEVAQMTTSSIPFTVLAHVDYPVRSWPRDETPFDPDDFEDDFRNALGALARSGRALELNTRVPLHATILRWWHDEGGESISFGSDAHRPDALARGFTDAVQLVEANGFRPGPTPWELWGRA